jgi:hypothetical protein
MKIEKYKLWLAFFIAIFMGTFSMIIWTIYSSAKADIHEDRSFLSTYQNVDDQFNQMVIDNSKFLKAYNIEFDINGNKTSLDIKDIFLAQRVLENKPTHKDFLKQGKNKVIITISSKEGKKIENPSIELLITRSTTNKSDIVLNSFKPSIGGRFSSEFDINELGNWNITGKVITKDNKGYIYLKTNVKQ